MAVISNEEDGRAELRKNMELFMLCTCGGPQPSMNNSRADEHRKDCPYRVEVEGSGNSGG